MPELPEVETTRRTLTSHLVGRKITSAEVRETRLRKAVEPNVLTRHLVGREITALRRRSKYLLIDTSGPASLAIHLGMSGRLRLVQSISPWQKHDHLALVLDDGRHLRLNDSRRFGLALSYLREAEGAHVLFRNLGVEPLDPLVFTAPYLLACCRKRTVAIKQLIMDASLVVGVGNIYACEALFRAGIHPLTPANHLKPQQQERLVSAIVMTLTEAIAKGGTTLRDFQDALGNAGYFARKLCVYGREEEPCLVCERRISRIVQGGRSTFYCSRCQRPQRGEKSRLRTSRQVEPAGMRMSVARE